MSVLTTTSSDCVLMSPMQIIETARFTFAGQLRADAFIDFARHRAARLDLSLDVETISDKTITLTVRGSIDLLDAFEMACSLGPHECLVLDVIRNVTSKESGRAI